MTTTAEGSVMDMREAIDAAVQSLKPDSVGRYEDPRRVLENLWNRALSHIGDGSKAEPVARIKVKSDGIGTAYSVVRPESLPDGVYPVYLGTAPTAQDSKAEPVFIRVCSKDHGPGEDFVEIETADGKGVRIPHIKQGKGRLIGPLYTHPAPTAQDDEAYELAEGVISRIIAFMGVRDDYFEGCDVPPVPMALEALDHLISGAKDSGLKFDAEENDFVVAQDSKVPEGYVLAKKADVESAINMMRYACHPHKSPHADDLEAGLLSAAPVPAKLQQVSCEERLPTEDDADAVLKVWAFGWDGSCHHIAYEYVCNGEHSHWQPTGLQRPAAPEGE